MHILVVDDDAGTRANLRDILELDDFRVETAGTAAEALGRPDWSRYAAVILDRRLPDGSAEELLPHLKRPAPHAAVPGATRSPPPPSWSSPATPTWRGRSRPCGRGRPTTSSSPSTPTPCAPACTASPTAAGWRRPRSAARPPSERSSRRRRA